MLIKQDCYFHALDAHRPLHIRIPDWGDPPFPVIGVAVQGTFEPGDCTLFKCEGDLSRYFVREGMIHEIEYSDMLCRTQMKVDPDDFSYFLTNPINNHHVICRGKHKAQVDAFFRLIH